MPQINVKLKENPYPVFYGDDALEQFIKRIASIVKNNKLFVFYDGNFYALHGKQLSKLLKKNFDCIEFVIPSGEKVKSSTEFNKIQNYLLSEKISRSDFILACGGGVTSDLIGYCASTVLRGVSWGIISTTLLGMVDAAIGGKTGINHKTGKNLIGSFYQPKAVACYPEYLMTLPEREIICGVGELAKYSGLIGEEMMEIFEHYIEQCNLYDLKILTKLIKQSVQYKADIVCRDEKEAGLRMLLNFGHTVGHAIEKSLGYGILKHGEAVILGLIAAVELSLLTDKNNDKKLIRYRKLLINLLEMVPKHNITKENIVNAVKYDKKRKNTNQKFILLRTPGKPIIIDSLDKKRLNQAINRMLDLYHGK